MESRNDNPLSERTVSNASTQPLDDAEMWTEEKQQIESVTILQRFFRRHMARKIKQLKVAELKKLPADFLGNDPSITNLEQYAATEGHVALIATSGVRAILLACELNEKNKTACIPKIFLIDYSERVDFMWKSMKAIAENNTTVENFLIGLSEFLSENVWLKNSSDDAEIRFFKYLFNLYSFDYVRKIILGTVFLRQDWENTSTFYKLKNYFKEANIKNKYVYASNIVACSPKSAHAILKNIQKIDAKLSIHTNLNILKHKPDTVYLCPDQSPEKVSSCIFPEEKSTADMQPIQHSAKKMKHAC